MFGRHSLLKCPVVDAANFGDFNNNIYCYYLLLPDNIINIIINSSSSSGSSGSSSGSDGGSGSSSNCSNSIFSQARTFSFCLDSFIFGGFVPHTNQARTFCVGRVMKCRVMNCRPRLKLPPVIKYFHFYL